MSTILPVVPQESILSLDGVAIGKITECYTSTDYKPTRELAEIATEGDPFVVTFGDAVDSRSCLLPILLVSVSMFVSGKVCGTYGIAISALGMLSFVGTTVSIDAFEPIADNAGGIAESRHLPKEVRAITDKLDAVGNTTAAIGKGFAIGSAAFATVTGDTVGDTRKDVIGVSLDIFIKAMSTIANTLAPIFSHFTLFR